MVRPAHAAPRARAIPAPLQVHVRPAHAAASIIRVCGAQKSSQQRLGHWLPAHCATTQQLDVCAPFLFLPYPKPLAAKKAQKLARTAVLAAGFHPLQDPMCRRSNVLAA